MIEISVSHKKCNAKVRVIALPRQHMISQLPWQRSYQGNKSRYRCNTNSIDLQQVRRFTNQSIVSPECKRYYLEHVVYYLCIVFPYYLFCSGFLSTRITESPRRNILEMYLSLFTGLDFFFPFPVLGTSVHISFTFSRTMLQCLSKALTLPSSFLLFLQLMRTCVLLFTLCVRTESGPVLNSSCS